MTADQNAGDGEVYYAISTDDRTTWTVIDNTDGERDIVRSNSGTWQYNSNGTYASETWVNGATNTELATLAEAMEGATTPYSMQGAAYDSVSLDISAQITQVKGMTFNNDGSKMYIVDNSGDGVREYEMSSAYSLSTASYARFFSTSAQETTPNSIAFNSDGSKMFIVGTTGDDVGEYALSTAFNVATASFTQNFSVATQDTSPFGIAFNTDGTKMFISADGSNSILEYGLSTGFDISTASYSQNFSVTDTNPRDIQFASSGTVMFLLGAGSDKVYKYSLSTAFDISTASLGESFSVNSQAANPQGMAISADGETMFISDDSSDSVYQYSTVLYTNQMDKTQLDAVTDPNHIALSNDFDLAIVFNMTSGSTVPSSDGVAINYDANVLNKGAVLGTDYDFDAPAQNSVRITALAGNNLKVRVV
jgi:sugar lactone lactonase YvrE